MKILLQSPLTLWQLPTICKGKKEKAIILENDSGDLINLHAHHYNQNYSLGLLDISKELNREPTLRMIL